MRKKMKIAIVGGGPGGLFTAHYLEKTFPNQCEVSIFEASPRCGGKIRSLKFETADIPYEAGTAELYDYSMAGPDTLRRLVDEMGLETVPMDGPALIWGDHILQSDKDIAKILGPRALKDLRTFHLSCAKLLSPASYYEDHRDEAVRSGLDGLTFRELLDRVSHPLARRYIERAAHSDVATESNLTSALNGVKNVLMDNPAYMSLYSVRGGLEALPRALVARLKARIFLNRTVTAVTAGPKGTYVVACTNKSGERLKEIFDRVVVALPDYYLRRLDYGDTGLSAAIDEHCRRYDRPAHYLRVSALFQSPFWRSRVRGNYFMSDAFGGCCLYDESSRFETGEFGVLSWLLAGHDALVHSNLSDAELIEKVLASLPAPLRRGADLFIEGKVHRWVGSINGIPGGQSPEALKKRHLPDSANHPGFYLVGDYLFDSTLNGVLDSAELVCDEIYTDAVMNHGVARSLRSDYFDYYDGEQPYEKCFLEFFDARYTTDLLKAVWRRKPPYKLLDVGSASGLTLREFEKIGVEAWGVENNQYIHSRTPKKLLKRNLLGDIRSLPFPDNSFDFVYDTSLCYVPEADLVRAINELRRVTRVGLIFGTITSDMTQQIASEGDILDGVQSLRSLWEWSDLILGLGFRVAVLDQETLDKVWKIETEANEGGPAWYPERELMRYCFYQRSDPERRSK